MKLSYRPEIDGFRAVSILIIFLSHIPTLSIQSGGVNLFFVISGFLITQIIYTKYLTNIIQFYSSRIKSLYPQLLLVALSVFIAYFFFGEPEYFITVYKSFKYSLLGIINIFFIREGTVYGQESFLNPFSPFWAFSVIIQFYLIYPYLLKLLINTKFLKSSLPIRLLMATGLFYIAYIFINTIYPNNIFTNFYSLFTRLWQFLLGASLYFYLLENQPKDIWKNTSAIISILLILVWQFYPDLDNNFNVKTFLISMIGVCIIYSSGHINIINKALASKWLVAFGKISYPFYLWHMAVIYFFYLYFTEINLFHIAMIFLITISLSIGSIRLNKFFLSYRRVSIYCLILVISISIISQLNRNFFISDSPKNFNAIKKKERLIFKQMNPNISASQQLLKSSDNNPCHPTTNFSNCDFHPEKENKVILLGTSHMAALSKPLTDTLLALNYHVQVITGSGCPYILDFYRVGRENTCNENYMQNVKNELMKEKATIIISMRFPLYLSGDFFINQDGFHESKDKLILKNKKSKSVYNGFYDSINELINYGHKVILIYPVPEFAINIPLYYRKNTHKFDSFEIPYDLYQKRTEESFKLLDSFSSSNVARVYPHEYICDERKNKCFSRINNKILYSDDDHLNLNGASLILDDILTKIDKLNKLQPKS